MASFYDLTIGQQVEFHRMLAAAGFTSDDVARIIKDPALASKMYEVIQPASLPIMAKYWPSLKQQLELVKQLNTTHVWGFSDTDFPSVFEGNCQAGELPLLCVYLPDKGRKQPGFARTFDALWDAIVPSNGYDKWRWDDLQATSKVIRQVPGYEYRPGIRWVLFSPDTYHGKSPKQALQLAEQDGRQLAGVEVLMATLLAPEWVANWDGRDCPCPWLSGLQVHRSTDWWYVPNLHRWDDCRRLGLDADWEGYAGVGWASPSVRERN